MSKESEENQALRKLQKLDPDAHCVYFPLPGFYQVWVWNKCISGEYATRIEALNDAIQVLSTQQPKEAR